MKANHVEAAFENVSSFSITKEKQGYSFHTGGQTLELPDATNFEWRCEKPVAISHLYHGSETGSGDDRQLRVQLERPCVVKVSCPDARCYVYIEK